MAADEDEDDDGGAIGGSLPVLKCLGLSIPKREILVLMLRRGILPCGRSFFYDGNLRLPITVFVADILEYYQIHISQLSPFGVFRIRNFEYTFRALGLAVSVENFRRFYQLTVNTGFFSFNQRYGSTKLMTPPKGVTKWKTKFFYVRTFPVYARMTFRDVNVAVNDEDIPIATTETVDWFSRLRPIELKRLDNNQLWVLRMMLTRPDRKERPVLREKSGETAVGLWRMFEPDFKGKVELVACELREGFNLEILGNFRVPTRAVMDAPVPEGAKAILADLGKFEKRIPKKHVEKKQVKKTTRGHGTYRSCYRRYTDYVVVSDTLEGLGVPGGSAAVSGKRKPEQSAAGGELKRVKLKARRAAPAQKKPAVAAEPQDAGFSFFDFPLPSSPTAAVDAGMPKEPEVPKEPAAPFEVTPDPTVQAEKTVEKTVSQIFDTVDSSNNLILDLRFSDAGKQKSDAEPRQADAEPQKSSAGEKVTGSSSGGAGYDGPPIQPGESELEYYYRTYTQDRSTPYHRPPWTVMQGDDISNDPSACKEILGGLGTPFETERARAAPRELHINQLSTMLVGSSIVANAILEDYKVLGRREEEAAHLRADAEELVKAARAGAEQLERDRAAFDKQKQTSEWAATAELKQVRTLAKLLSDERKSWDEKFSNERKKWNESWAKQNDNLFRARQELANAKAANARAVKALDEAKEAGARAAKALEEAKERESRSSKVLEAVNAERTRLDQVVASLQAEVQNREVVVTDLTTRVTVAEERANAAVEARDALTSSFHQLEADREWMRCRGIAHIVQTIMDAPETATGIDLIKQRARDVGFKAGYNRCIGHINVMSKGGYTDQRSGFRDVDTEALLDATVASFYDMSFSCVEKLDECLEVAVYVDRLRMLYADAEEEEPAGSDQGGAGTSGTK
ncbi:hypothetical protein Hanom_Chr10g00923031 [Helianthus anomalus]